MGDKTFEVTAQNFQQEVLDSETPVLVDFWATWCGPCKMIAPIVDELAVEYEDKLRVGKLDADAHQSILQQYRIMAIPTLILFKDGAVAVRIQGFRPKGALEAELIPHLN